MGNNLGIDFPNEQKGYFPSSSYFDRIYQGQRWNSLRIISLGIGQGELLTTNLQLANMAAMIANRGHYITPHIVRALQQPNQEPNPIEYDRVDLEIDSAHFEPVIEGMELVTRAGTAKLAYIPEIPVCGKTGTAENKGEDHSIFFAFAPKKDPKIAIVVYVENGGFGGSTAAPIAGLMIEKYLRGYISPGRQWIEDRMMELNLMDKYTP